MSKSVSYKQSCTLASFCGSRNLSFLHGTRSTLGDELPSGLEDARFLLQLKDPERNELRFACCPWGVGSGSAGKRVALSTKHTLALTNRGGATTEELLALAREVRDGVEARFGVRLVNEPVTVGCSL